MAEIKINKMSECVHAQLIRCPVCSSKLELAVGGGTLKCQRSDCGRGYPVIKGVPILIDENVSIFNISDYSIKSDITFNRSESSLARVLNFITPSISHSLSAKRIIEIFVQSLLKQGHRPKVLIVGGSIEGEGTTTLYRSNQLELVETDVTFGPRTQIICDCHSLPFGSEQFDGVLVQAVLEHVVDPVRCVSEIHRVLKPGGVVYAETPFMQQVHMGRYDFTRFTHLGHRRLFRGFDEIESGVSAGGGMVLAWAFRSFLMSFSMGSRKARKILSMTAMYLTFWLKYFDYMFIQTPEAFDSGSGYYFIGKRSPTYLSDRDLIRCYRGAQQ
jgi:SAM-dependent methyltransferase